MIQTPPIRVILPISEEEIRTLVRMSNEHHGTNIVIDEERLKACLGMELSFDDFVTLPTEEDNVEYGRFLMGVTASVINYYHLVKDNGTEQQEHISQGDDT